MVIEVLSEYHYLLMLMNLLPGYWKYNLERMNMKFYEDNGKAVGMANVRYRKVGQFSGNEF